MFLTVQHVRFSDFLRRVSILSAFLQLCHYFHQDSYEDPGQLTARFVPSESWFFTEWVAPPAVEFDSNYEGDKKINK